FSQAPLRPTHGVAQRTSWLSCCGNNDAGFYDAGIDTNIEAKNETEEGEESGRDEDAGTKEQETKEVMVLEFILIDRSNFLALKKQILGVYVDYFLFWFFFSLSFSSDL
ncbi:unnamed protein product, partial [Brassica oleracea]